MDCHFLLQGIFPTQELKLGLQHCRQTLYRTELGHMNQIVGMPWKSLQREGHKQEWARQRSVVEKRGSSNGKLILEMQKTAQFDSWPGYLLAVCHWVSWILSLCFSYLFCKTRLNHVLTSYGVGRRQWHPTPVLLPGQSHGWRSLVGCSPWVTKSRTRLRDFTFTFHFPALEKEMATHSSVLAWRIPGTGEPGGLPSMGSHRVGHD